MSVDELVTKINDKNKNEMELLKSIVETQGKIIDELNDLTKRVILIEKTILRRLS